MPSIDLIRLRKQIAHLGIFLEIPAEFVSEYKSLLEFYHQWSHHQHEEQIPNSFMLLYDLPPQVIPEIEKGLKPFLRGKENALFPLASPMGAEIRPAGAGKVVGQRDGLVLVEDVFDIGDGCSLPGPCCFDC